MDKLKLVLRQQLSALEKKLDSTTNPIEYIKLATQIGCTSEILRIAEQLTEKPAKPEENTDKN